MKCNNNRYYLSTVGTEPPKNTVGTDPSKNTVDTDPPKYTVGTEPPKNTVGTNPPKNTVGNGAAGITGPPPDLAPGTFSGDPDRHQKLQHPEIWHQRGCTGATTTLN